MVDEPYVEIAVVDAQGNSLGPEGGGGGILGYNPYARLLLDTGANGILVVDAAAQSLEDNGLVTEAEFLEVGVGGYTVYEVTAPYQFNFTGSDGVTHSLPLTNDGVRILSSSSAQLGGSVDDYGIAGLVGMPAMTGRVTRLDMSHWSDLEDLFDITPISVTFPETEIPGSGSVPTLPDGNGHRYTVPLDNRLSFSPDEGRPEWEDPDSALPTYADVPFFTAKVSVTNEDGETLSRTGTFLLDTGAQMSIISRSTAFRLGLDADGDGDLWDDRFDYVVVGGVGGQRTVPIHVVDSLRIPTNEGVDLMWADTSPDSLGLGFVVMDLFPCSDANGDGFVGTADLDIVRANWNAEVTPGDMTRGDFTSDDGEDYDGLVSGADLDLIRSQWGDDTFIDGIIGTDFLTAGLDIMALFLGEPAGDPSFQQIHFDFRDWENGNGTLVLDVSASYDNVVTPGVAVPEPGLGILLLGGLLFIPRALRRICRS